MRGGPVMWPLLACSLVSLTVAIDRMLFWIGAEPPQQRAAAQRGHVAV
ncbi:MAG: hypothetical protein MZV70_19185 [Desulfobacterales bacterium]|nr:hypothetical protein [Desulfobacterales bacterium]